MENGYKKSYRGFVLWLAVFLVVNIFISPMICMKAVEEFASYIAMSICILFIDLLTYIIYRTGYIYWYNGMPYDKAAKATPEERREYAYAHMIAFVRASIAWFAYGAFKLFFHIGWWADIIVFVVVMISAAVGTMGIKLNN